jgi:hypothetical protein
MATRLYEVLGVEKDATPSAIKKAYHRLALTCHPDKVGPSGEAQFKQISEAHAVLSDPQKRAIYDRHGEQGLTMMNNDLAAPMMDQMGLHLFLIVAAILMLFTSACATAVVSSVASKLDGHLDSWSWATTLWGLWLWESVVMLVVLVYVISIVHSICVDAEHSRANFRHFIVPFVAVLYFVWSVLVAINLDHHSMKWTAVAVPFVLAEICIFVLTLPSINPRDVTQTLNIQGITKIGKHWLVLMLFARFIGSVYRPITAILVGMRADGLDDSSWLWALSPVIFYLLLSLGESIAITSLSVDNGKIASRDRISAIAGSLVLVGMFMATVMMIGLRADGAIDVTAGKCLIPVLLMLSGWIVGSCVMLCVAGALASREANSDYQNVSEESREAASPV